jgi:mono/diheme cytochrome c family protein
MKTAIGVGATIVALALGARTVAAGTPQGKTATDVYLDKCAVCHGPDGAGKTAKGKKLKVKDVRETSAKMTAAQMIDVVTKGKDPDMDGFGKELATDMIRQIVDYYRGLAKK